MLNESMAFLRLLTPLSCLPSSQADGGGWHYVRRTRGATTPMDTGGEGGSKVSYEGWVEAAVVRFWHMQCFSTDTQMNLLTTGST